MVFLYTEVWNVPLSVLELRQIKVWSTNAQIGLLVNEDSHWVEWVDVHPLSQIKLSHVSIRILVNWWLHFFGRSHFVRWDRCALLLFRFDCSSWIIKLGYLILIQEEWSFNVLLHNLWTHLLLVCPAEHLTETTEAEYSNTSGSEARLAYPDVVRAVDVTVLVVAPLQFFVHLVCLIHDIHVWDLPSPELENIRVDMSQFDLYFFVIACYRLLQVFNCCLQGHERILMGNSLLGVNRELHFWVFNQKVQDSLVKFECGLIKISLDEFFAFAVLSGLQKEVSRIENCIAE